MERWPPARQVSTRNPMASVELKNVSKAFRLPTGEEVRAINNLNLSIHDGELLVLIGPSGCGKTTTLRLIAGLEEISSGQILINGQPVNGVPPQNRDLAMVFQRDALYPHMTVFENLAFGLELRKLSRDEIQSRIESTAARLGISPLLHRHPRALSGGERQRAALGRALVRQPKILLLDEPLSHLDAPLRAQLRREISQLHTQLGLTMLYVTHEQLEARALATNPSARLAVMRAGAIEQVGAARSLLEDPANEFVADFFGTA
jgi:ABC-type sugar transport system ATPase subunit